MSDNVKYLSTQWRDAVDKRLKTELTPEIMNNITSSIVNIHHNCPDGEDKYLYISYIDGVLDKTLVGEGEGPQAEFLIIGDYEVYVNMFRSEISAQMALLTGKLKLKGEITKALKLAFIADKINKVLVKIPVDY